MTEAEYKNIQNLWNSHAFELKRETGMSTSQFQNKIDYEAKCEVMSTVKVYIKYIIDARDKLKNYTGNDEASQKMRFSLENGKKKYMRTSSQIFEKSS